MFTDTLKQAFTAARAVHLNIRLLRHFFKENLPSQEWMCLRD